MSVDGLSPIVKAVAGTALVYFVWSWLNQSYDPMTWNTLGLIIGFLIVGNLWVPDKED